MEIRFYHGDHWSVQLDRRPVSLLYTSVKENKDKSIYCSVRKDFTVDQLIYFHIEDQYTEMNQKTDYNLLNN